MNHSQNMEAKMKTQILLVLAVVSLFHFTDAFGADAAGIIDTN